MAIIPLVSDTQKKSPFWQKGLMCKSSNTYFCYDTPETSLSGLSCGRPDLCLGQSLDFPFCFNAGCGLWQSFIQSWFVFALAKFALELNALFRDTAIP